MKKGDLIYIYIYVSTSRCEVQFIVPQGVHVPSNNQPKCVVLILVPALQSFGPCGEWWELFVRTQFMGWEDTGIIHLKNPAQQIS